MKKKVLVAMSGGVDSSVAAYLLKKSGYETTGVTMCLGISDADSQGRAKCCGASAIEDAKTVCRKLDIAHYVLDFSKEMEREVVRDFISEYQSGRTPNPCVRCNQYLKFGKLFEYARRMDFSCLAAGHYARIKKLNRQFLLCRPKDKQKDQTYFLYCLAKEKLGFILFPLANYTKQQVRLIARKLALSVADKPQSQDICFISGSYKDFVLNRSQASGPGNIVDLKGNVLGKHKGTLNYTYGQRQGLGLAAPKPLYVVAINAKEREVVVGEKKDLRSKTLSVDNFNQLVEKFPRKAYVKIRYGHKETPCQISFSGDKIVKVIFEQPQEAVTPGQSAVFYHKDIVCGGGIISGKL